MIDIVAKPVIKNKFWIVERDGEKYATIQAIDESGGFAYVHDEQREIFPSIKVLSKAYNIRFEKADKPVKQHDNDVYGFPVKGNAYNQVLDVQRYLPIYTTSAKSKSFYCAGFYLVKFGTNWALNHCPKLITLNRYEYQGPFKTKERATEVLNELQGQ